MFAQMLFGSPVRAAPNCAHCGRRMIDGRTVFASWVCHHCSLGQSQSQYNYDPTSRGERIPEGLEK